MALLHTKKSPPRTYTPTTGAGKWSNLETLGDVRRFLKWLILQTNADKMDLRKAAVLGQLTTYMLRAMELETLETRLIEIEQKLALPVQLLETSQHDEPHDPHQTH